MPITVYQSTDSGAPVLNGNQNSFANVLKACLVDGYGSKPSSGWSMPFGSGSDYVFRAPIGLRPYFRAQYIDYQQTIVYAYASMTSETVGTDGTGGYFYTSANPSWTTPWVLIADQKRFWFFHNGNVDGRTTSFSTLSGLTTNNVTFFGEIISQVPNDSYHYAFVANLYSYNPYTSYFGNLYDAAHGCKIARPYTQVGSWTRFQHLAPFHRWYYCLGADGWPYPSPSHGGIDMYQPFIMELDSGFVCRGHFPGLMVPMHNKPGALLDTFTGRPGTSIDGITFMILPVSVANSSTGHIFIQISGEWT